MTQLALIGARASGKSERPKIKKYNGSGAVKSFLVSLSIFIHLSLGSYLLRCYLAAQHLNGD